MTFNIPNGVASDKFGVSRTGMVTLLSPLDREQVSRYSVPIFARSSKLIDLAILEIFVLDENDNDPKFSSGSCYTVAVPENQGNADIFTLIASDADEGKNAVVSYTITSKHDFLRY